MLKRKGAKLARKLTIIAIVGFTVIFLASCGIRIWAFAIIITAILIVTIVLATGGTDQFAHRTIIDSADAII